MRRLSSIAVWISLLTSASLWAQTELAAAADFEARFAAPIADTGARWDIRAGAFAHGVGSVESGTVDLNFEVATPRLPFDIDPAWRVLVPRLHAGVNANLSGKTHVVYTGLLWTYPLTQSFFAEAFIGPALHNGLQNSPVYNPNRVDLGCPVLFHVGGSLGYRITSTWSIIGTFDHVSNGNMFGTGCEKNQGLNNYGARLAVSF